MSKLTLSASINIFNGPLTEDRPYRLLQRGLDDKRTVIITRAWTDTIQTIKKNDDGGSSLVGIIVGVVVAVILGILIVIAVFYIRSRGGNYRKQIKGI